MVLGTIAGSTMSASDAVAQEISSEQKQRFADAQRLYDEKKYDEALPKFQELLAETKSPNARLYVARCLRELGRLPEAYDEMAATVREAKQKAETEKKYESTRDASASELSLLADRIGHVVIAITGAPADVVVTLNGVTMTAERLDTPITVVPGNSHIEISGTGIEAVSRDVEVKGGETKTAAIALAASRTDTADPTKPTPPTETKGGGLRIGGIVVGSAGVASFGVFGALFALAGARYSTLEEECGAARCTGSKYEDIVDQGKSFELGAFVMLGVGSAMIAAAVPMIILGGPESKEAPNVTVLPVAGGAVVLVGGAL